MEYNAMISKEKLVIYDLETGLEIFLCTFEKLKVQADLLQIKYSEYVRKAVDHLLTYFDISPTAVVIV